MFWTTLHNQIRKAFSDAAPRYDLYADVHKEIGRELVKKLVPKVQGQRLLDVGTGTGYVARKLKYFFPEAQVIGVDFAPGMIAQARAQGEGIEFIEADARSLPFEAASFDAVVSNLAYQWAGDLPAAFGEAARVLRPEGILGFTCFGFGTCAELFDVLGRAAGGALSFERLASVDEVRRQLEGAGFRPVAVDYEVIKVEFEDLWDLLRWLKNIGANGLGHSGFVGRDLLVKADALYRQSYRYHNGVETSFEVIWAEGVK